MKSGRNAYLLLEAISMSFIGDKNRNQVCFFTAIGDQYVSYYF